MIDNQAASKFYSYTDSRRLHAMAAQDLADEREYLREGLADIGENVNAANAFLVDFYRDWAKALDVEIGKRSQPRKNLWPAGETKRRFSSDQIANIKSHTDTVALVESYGVEMRKNGGSWKGLCPFHTEKTPSFTVWPNGSWHCFGCKKSGDCITFVMEQENKKFPDAVRTLAQKAGVLLSETKTKLAQVTALDISQDFHLSDVGNGQRLIARHGSKMRFNHPLNTWFIWNGKVWQEDIHGQAKALVLDTIKNIYVEASEAETKEEREKLSKWATLSESAARGRGILYWAKSLPGVPVKVAEMDQDLWLLNVENGTVDLRTGVLRAHQREDLITKLAPVYYDPNATDDILDNFLATASGDNENFLSYLQKAVGYTLLGTNAEAIVFLMLGVTKSGKSTFLSAFLAALGSYAHAANFETFLKQKHGGQRPRADILQMRGTRLVTALEPERGRWLAEAEIKAMSGGDKVTVRGLYQKKEVTFSPTWTIWLAANEAPRLSNDDDAIWERLRRLPFETHIPKTDRDPEVKHHLTHSAKARSAFLAWAIKGCLAVQGNGLGSCDVVERKTAELRADMDPLGEFKITCCIESKNALVKAEELRQAYDNWTEEMGVRKPISDKQWSAHLKKYRKGRPRGINGKQSTVYYGIGLKELL